MDGASNGLGYAAAEALDGEGASVFLVARDEAQLSARAKNLGAGHFAGSIADPDVPSRAVDAAVSALGGLDILITNAGAPAKGGFVDVPLDGWNDAFELTLMSVVRLCRAALPHLESSTAGRILMITSVAVRQPIDGYVLHSAFLSAATAAAKVLSREVVRKGIMVNAVQSGYILTERNAALHQAEASERSVTREEITERAGLALPAGRLGRPEEFGPLCAFLCSDRSSYITGQSIAIDGGLVSGIH